MEIIQIITLAIIQGLTEFLPVSSSGHLILTQQVLGWADQGQAFDVALHFGSAIAVIGYFRKDLGDIISGWFKSIKTKEQTNNSRIGWGIIIGTIPACIAGLLIKVLLDGAFRSPLIVASTLIIFGLLLGWASVKCKGKRDITTLSIKDMLLIGIAQAFALIPGTSRSGITITAALAMGLTPVAAARFSFLLSIPAILMASGLHVIKMLSSTDAVNWGDMIIGAGVAAVTAFLCIHFFLKLIQKINMVPFVLYRIAMGIYLIYLFA